MYQEAVILTRSGDTRRGTTKTGKVPIQHRYENSHTQHLIKKTKIRIIKYHAKIATQDTIATIPKNHFKPRAIHDDDDLGGAPAFQR